MPENIYLIIKGTKKRRSLFCMFKYEKKIKKERTKRGSGQIIAIYKYQKRI